MEGVFRQIVEPDAGMKKNTKNQYFPVHSYLAVTRHTRSLSGGCDSALVLNNHTLHCIKTKPKNQ